MATRTTWEPHEGHGELSTTRRGELPESVFAFPEQRKEPLVDAAHVRNALSRFDQVEGVSDSEKDMAFANIAKAAKHYDVRVDEKDWRDLGKTDRASDSSR